MKRSGKWSFKTVFVCVPISMANGSRMVRFVTQNFWRAPSWRKLLQNHSFYSHWYFFLIQPCRSTEIQVVTEMACEHLWCLEERQVTAITHLIHWTLLSRWQKHAGGATRDISSSPGVELPSYYDDSSVCCLIWPRGSEAEQRVKHLEIGPGETWKHLSPCDSCICCQQL